jgi:hypothetical protein
MWTKKKYVEFLKNVDDFFKKNEVDMMSNDTQFDDDGEPIETEPYFSKWPCEVCGSHYHGNREDYVAWKHGTDNDEKIKVAVCIDCVYHNEYGRLDDDSMWDIDKDECPAIVKGEPVMLVGPVDGNRFVAKSASGELSPVGIEDIEFPD